jgi:hypothetical protein
LVGLLIAISPDDDGAHDFDERNRAKMTAPEHFSSAKIHLDKNGIGNSWIVLRGVGKSRDCGRMLNVL